MSDPDGWRETDKTQREEIARLRALDEHSFKRITELEAIAREIIKAHRDVETGLEVPKYIYQMAVAAIEK